MDLNKGGLADSPRPNTAYNSNSRSNSFPSASTTQTSIVPRTKTSETSTKKKSNKRKKDKVERDGDGQEKGESTSSGVSKKKKSRNDNTPQTVQPEMIRTQTPISHARSTTREEESENASMAPPSLRASQQTSQYRLNGLNAFSAFSIINNTTTEDEEGGFIDYTSPQPESRFFSTARSASHESADGGVQSPSIVQLKEEEQERVEEGGEYGDGVAGYVQEDEIWRDQAEGGQRFSRFSQSSHFGSRHFSPRNDYEQASLSSPPPAQPELGEDSENALGSPPLLQVGEQSPSSPKARAETLAKPEIDPLNPITSLFSGSNPFLKHAKALVQSKGMAVEGDKTVKAEDIVEKVKSENVDFVNRFKGILEKTQSLFERSLSRQLELVSKLENHSAQLAKEDEQIKETKERLANWSGQLLKEGKGEGEHA